MKITRSYLKQLIKEELQEFKGAKPVETMRFTFTYKLGGELHTFSDFKLEPGPFSHDGTPEQKFDSAVRSYVHVPGQAPVGARIIYDYLRRDYLDQVPNLADKTVESSYGARPLKAFKLDTLMTKYQEKDSRYHGFLPLSVTVTGGRYDGLGTTFVNIAPKKPGPSDFTMVPKKDREEHGDSMWRAKTQAEKDAEIAAGKRKPS